jgi:hypothetical protein
MEGVGVTNVIFKIKLKLSPIHAVRAIGEERR